jgi:LytR cell envelope-related transcriptional attenuator
MASQARSPATAGATQQQTRVTAPARANSGPAAARPGPNAGPRTGVGARPPAAGRPAGAPARPGAGALGRPAPSPGPAAPRPWYRRLAARYVALIVAGLVVVGAAVAYGVTELAAERPPAPAPPPPGQAGGAPGGPVDPSTVTVAVLNGTPVPGLAGQVADSVESAGFQRGTVANATEQASAESVVLHAEGAQPAAREVAQELGISQTEPMDQTSRELAAGAQVVVVVGNDQTE